MRFRSIVLAGVAAMAAVAAGAQQSSGWELTGVVTYNSKPVKRAWVNAQGESRVNGVQTDAQGRYSLKGAVPGWYQVKAFMDDEPDEGDQIRRTMGGGCASGVASLTALSRSEDQASARTCRVASGLAAVAPAVARKAISGGASGVSLQHGGPSASSGTARA